MLEDREFCADFIGMFFFKKRIYRTLVLLRVLDITKNTTAQLENWKLLKINFHSVRLTSKISS
jgi:hypothetical protein